MTLQFHPPYPSARSYVLQLHRHAAPPHDRIAGRLENMASGRRFDFGNGAELLACLAHDLARGALEAQADPAEREEAR